VAHFSVRPARVIVFRGGVGYGKMARLKAEEVPAVQAGIGKVSLVYCIVQIHSRVKLIVGQEQGKIRPLEL
jgi:hypothetical protein